MAFLTEMPMEEEMEIPQQCILAQIDFKGPNCMLRLLDLGIALGSAVKTAQIHNVDNRIMYRAGVAAYAEAGIKNPRQEISIAEIHKRTSSCKSARRRQMVKNPRRYP